MKVKIFNKTKTNSLFKFFDINEYRPEQYLSMSIEDLNKKNLLDSINLNNYIDNSDSKESNNQFDYSNKENDSGSNSENEYNNEYNNESNNEYNNESENEYNNESENKSNNESNNEYNNESNNESNK